MEHIVSALVGLASAAILLAAKEIIDYIRRARAAHVFTDIEREAISRQIGEALIGSTQTEVEVIDRRILHKLGNYEMYIAFKYDLKAVRDDLTFR